MLLVSSCQTQPEAPGEVIGSPTPELSFRNFVTPLLARAIAAAKMK